MSASPDYLGDLLIERIGEGNMGNNAALKESPRPKALGTVNHLVRNDKVSRFDLFLQAPNCGEGDDGSHANRAQGGNVGSGRDLVRRELMVQTMATEKSHRDYLSIMKALVVQDGDGRRGVAPRRRDGQGSNLCETREFTKAGAPDDCNADGIYLQSELAIERTASMAWWTLAAYRRRRLEEQPFCGLIVLLTRLVAEVLRG